MTVLSEEELYQFAKSLLAAGGAGQRQAEIVGDSLVQANLRGHDSHGVMRIPFYIDRVKAGALNPQSELQVERESPGVLACDGGWGFGQVLSRDLMSRLIQKAPASGIVSGTLRRAAHIGRLGEYAEMAAAAGLAALIFANTNGAAQRVAPVGGKRPRLGTNPLCIGVPGGKDGPFILDFGTSATAEGKVRVKRIAGDEVPPGWILDPDGHPTTDPNQLYGEPPGTILPMGGDQAYKGFGLSFAIELLCGGLSGGRCAYPDPPPPLGNAVVFILTDPASFAGLQHLSAEAAQVEEYVRSVPLISGVSGITLPGDPERQVLEARRRDGVPLDEGNWRALTELADDLGVTVPQSGATGTGGAQ